MFKMYTYQIKGAEWHLHIWNIFRSKPANLITPLLYHVYGGGGGATIY